MSRKAAVKRKTNEVEVIIDLNIDGKGRTFKFKTVLTTKDTNQDIRVSQLGYIAEFQRRTEQSTTTIASGAGAKSISFNSPFFTGTSALLGANSNPPAIGITAFNMASGDLLEQTSKTGTGFTVHFKNRSGSSVERKINLTNQKNEVLDYPALYDLVLYQDLDFLNNTYIPL